MMSSEKYSCLVELLEKTLCNVLFEIMFNELFTIRQET